MDNLLQDVRYGMRTLARQPRLRRHCHPDPGARHRRHDGHLSVVNAVVLRPLPFAQRRPNRGGHQRLHAARHQRGTGPCRGPTCLDWREQSRSFAVAGPLSRSWETSVPRRQRPSDYAMVGTDRQRATFDVFGGHGCSSDVCSGR